MAPLQSQDGTGIEEIVPQATYDKIAPLVIAKQPKKPAAK